jgi:hypothetical protein
MLTDHQDQINIAMFLLRFKMDTITKNVDWPLFTDIVSDFSFANLNAISVAWNGVALKTYLQDCFDFWQGEKSIVHLKHYTWVHLCAKHLLDSFEMNATKHYTNRGTQLNIKKILGNFLLIRSFETYQQYLQNVIKLFTIHSKNDPEYEVVLNMIQGTSASLDVDTFIAKYTASDEEREEAIPVSRFFYKIL